MTEKKLLRPLIASQRQAVLNKTESFKDNEALGLEKSTEEIVQLKIPRALNEKIKQKKHSEKRMVIAPTRTSVPEQRGLPVDQNSVGDEPNRIGKAETVFSNPSSDLTGSDQADTSDEKIVKKDNAQAAEPAVETLALVKKPDRLTDKVGEEEHISEEADKANTLDPENLVRETEGTEAIEKRFSDGAPQETKIALGSQHEGNSSRVPRRAGYAHRISPEYPERARRKGWEGTTLLRVLVDRQGKSKVIQVSQSSGFGALDGAAVKAVEQWRFHPAQNGNGPVESWVSIPIIFRLVRDQN